MTTLRLRRLVPWSRLSGLVLMAPLWLGPLLAAPLTLGGCMADVEDDAYPFVDDEAGEVELEVIGGVAQSVTDEEGSEPRPDVPEASGNPLEIGFEMEPVPEPWQGKGSEK